MLKTEKFMQIFFYNNYTFSPRQLKLFILPWNKAA